MRRVLMESVIVVYTLKKGTDFIHHHRKDDVSKYRLAGYDTLANKTLSNYSHPTISMGNDE